MSPNNTLCAFLRYLLGQADFYGLGKSEEILGKALKKYNIPRSKVVILTKCYFGVDDDVITPSGLDLMTATINDGKMVNNVGLSRKHIFDAVEASFTRYDSSRIRKHIN
jgi:aryl-alcohol dehydrogenase-like predicted oxidoreductase